MILVNLKYDICHKKVFGSNYFFAIEKKINIENIYSMFTIEYREKVRQRIIRRAREDVRIVSAAEVGSYASDAKDRWSDLDLTFGVDESQSVNDILNSYSDFMFSEFSGKKLLDIRSGKTIYRVFILPGCLQVDLSFSPESAFGAAGPHFNLLYGKQFEIEQPPKQSVDELLGYTLHHLLRGWISIERNKLWQAEFWISEARNYILKIACISNNLNPNYGRGFDSIPELILEQLKGSLICELSKNQLQKSLRIIISSLPSISKQSEALCAEFKDMLEELNVSKI